MITYDGLAGETDPQLYPFYELIRGDREQVERRLPIGGYWNMYFVDRPEDAVLDRAEELHPGLEVLRLSPQVDSDVHGAPLGIRRVRVNDIDAALEYLALGGVLMRLPDEVGNRACWSLYAVLHPATAPPARREVEDAFYAQEPSRDLLWPSS